MIFSLQYKIRICRLICWSFLSRTFFSRSSKRLFYFFASNFLPFFLIPWLYLPLSFIFSFLFLCLPISIHIAVTPFSPIIVVISLKLSWDSVSNNVSSTISSQPTEITISYKATLKFLCD